MSRNTAPWPTATLGEIANISSGHAPLPGRGLKAVVIMGANGPIGYTDRANFSNGYLVGRVGAAGAVQRVDGPCWASDNTLTVLARPDLCTRRFLGHLLRWLAPSRLATQTAQSLITQTQLRAMKFEAPRVIWGES
jgi:type I restriction enzyme S subunit